MKKIPSPHSKTKKVSNKGLHPRNAHRQGYDFTQLCKVYPVLKTHITVNRYGQTSIDFSNPISVKALNNALLKSFYGISDWDIPNGYLCPPIPGRADYIHYMADLLDTTNKVKTATISSKVKMLDIGCGANGIYSILANRIYGWQCVGSDIDPGAIENIKNIIKINKTLNSNIEIRQQKDKHHIFKGLITTNESFDLSVCNPPFYESQKDADTANRKKTRNLASNQTNVIKHPDIPSRNFGGQNTELWCKGGESRFLRIMIKESKEFSERCRWFSSLVSKKENIEPARKLLKKLKAGQIKEIKMNQGNKITRILAWSFIP